MERRTAGMKKKLITVVVVVVPVVALPFVDQSRDF